MTSWKPQSAKEFNKFDLYSKADAVPDMEKLKPYYASLLKKYNLDGKLRLGEEPLSLRKDFSIDFLVRVFTEPPVKSGQAFSLKPVATGADALGVVNSGKKSKK
ncbi:Inositol oxygenase [Symbiodinium microadriaticum]|uniref:Inositol oxygenase n=1 Tax=Symbiodinium microadriaticum TaxID=2951 RepID=A0A1Q9DH51_SYMMI|nr:Inositol oxygenase [Symbiodinium microadriaticum]